MRIYILLFAVFLMTNCMSAQRFTDYIEPNFPQLDTIQTVDFLSFDLSELQQQNKSVVSVKAKSQFVPAILYWQWNNTINCDLDPQTVGNFFKKILSEM